MATGSEVSNAFLPAHEIGAAGAVDEPLKASRGCPATHYEATIS